LPKLFKIGWKEGITIKAVAYCRVSTKKEEQLDSLESQQIFFQEYAKRNNYELIRIYADEGKSGTKIKNRTQLLRLLSDASEREFDLVLIKDVSRLARNTVDFLTSIRKLKNLGAKVIFVNYDQTSSDSSEFMLTMLSAIAQEESANTSKRVKFGKKINAQNGKIPNLIFGYDKVIGDLFHLYINEKEAETVRRIFHMYVNLKYGTNRIAKILNQEGIKTKRNCTWSQNAVARILSNPIYIGNVINGKEEVADFLTGERREVGQEKWMITYKPELKIVDETLFNQARGLLEKRKNSFSYKKEREIDTYIFSKLIHCGDCQSTFRRTVRTYKNTYITWVCARRNSNGIDSCPNATSVSEEEILNAILDYIQVVISKKPELSKIFFHELLKQYKRKDNKEQFRKELTQKMMKLKGSKEKYIKMYENDIISLDELKQVAQDVHNEISVVEDELKRLKDNVVSCDDIELGLCDAFNNINLLLTPEFLTNHFMKRVIDDIIIDNNKKADIYIKKFSDNF
jgi:site-specific DNA recombinase